MRNSNAGKNMTETTLKNNILKMIRSEFPGTWVYKASDRWMSGIPDLILCVGTIGKFAAIEVKTEKGKLLKIQEYVIAKINASGGHARVCRSVNEAREFLKSIGGDGYGSNGNRERLGAEVPGCQSETRFIKVAAR